MERLRVYEGLDFPSCFPLKESDGKIRGRFGSESSRVRTANLGPLDPDMGCVP